MGLGARVTRHFFSRSERVKAVDIHPTEPLLLCGLYDGHLKICNFSSLQLIADIDVSPLPLRAAAFVPRRDWVACAGDDCSIRCFSLHTQEKIQEVANAHKDYIRHLDIHPTRGLALSSSDDMTIKLWDMDQGWLRLCSFEAHAHYVMQTAWHPRDSTIFASCSLDRSIKVWGIGSVASGSKATTASSAAVTSAHFTLLGHERGVNAIAYSSSGERPYLVSGADDSTVRVWDYQTKQCVQVLRGHSKNVCSVLFGGCSPHALPVLFSAGEDGRLCVWNALTYKEEAALDLGLDRIWALALRPKGEAGETGAAAGLGGVVIAVGSDAGTLVLKMGKEGPVVSAHGGKAILARGFDLVQLNLRLLDEAFADGEKIQHLPAKPVASPERPIPRRHRRRRICHLHGAGKTHASSALRNKAFGPCEDFCWSRENHYAVLEKGNRGLGFDVRAPQAYNFTPPFAVEELFGGYLLGLRSDDSVSFYDWNSYRLIRRIEVCPRAVYWSADGMQVAIAARSSLTSASSPQAAGVDRLYILRHDKFAVMAANAAQALEEEGGIPIAFELVYEQGEEGVTSGLWLADCFVYTTRSCRLRYFCGGRAQTLRTLEAKELSILAVVSEQNRIYLVSPSHAVFVFTLNQAAIHYQAAVARGDLDAANAIFPQLPQEEHDEAARALQAHGYLAEALAVARNEQLRFELALALGSLQTCAELIRGSSSSAAVKRQRWAAVGDAALKKGFFSLAAAAFWECRDYASLLLLYSSSGDVERMRQLGAAAAAAQQHQIAFMCFLVTHQLDACVELLLAGNKAPEAALFARTFSPSAVEKAVGAWRETRLAAADAAAAAAAAAGGRRSKSSKNAKDNEEQEVQLPAFPSERPEAFPKLEAAKQAERTLSEFYSRQVPAASYGKIKDLLEADVLQAVDEGGPNALRTMLLGDAISFASTEPPQHQSPRANGATGSSLSSTQETPITIGGAPSPLSCGDAPTPVSAEPWQLQQQQQQLLRTQQQAELQQQQLGVTPQQMHASPHLQQQQQQQLPGSCKQEEAPISSSPLSGRSPLQQQGSHYPYAAADNPFSQAAFARDGFSFGGGEERISPQQQQQQLQQQQLQQQQLLLSEHPEQLLAQRLQQQEELLEEDARRLGDEGWGDPLESAGEGDASLNFRDVL
ncbi:hypothetical protein Efla_007278 [Eimeria flavescens]